MDFLNLYKLGLDWIDEELHIIDKKAQIKAPLKFISTSYTGRVDNTNTGRIAVESKQAL